MPRVTEKEQLPTLVCIFSFDIRELEREVDRITEEEKVPNLKILFDHMIKKV